MKTLAIAASLALVALVGSTAGAQQYGAPPVPTYDPNGMPPPDPNAPQVIPPGSIPYPQQYPQQQYPQPQPQYGVPQDPYADTNAAPAPVAGDDNYDEDGYDVDYDVYYDTVAAENYDDGYDPNAYQQFQQSLAPYGDWQNDPSYGEVWAPSSGVVGADFAPYSTGGHWVMTEYGWTWVSDYDWGWGPFHYGRWIDRAGRGWCWVPGSIWGPAWVSWRSGGGYAGWAPLPPRGVTVGPPHGVRTPWNFVLAGELGAVHPHYMPSQVVPGVFAKTSVVTNLRTANAAGMSVRFNAGPSAASIHAPIRAVPLRSFAPRAMPRPTVTPHAGMPLQARPWFHNTPVMPRPVAPTGPRSSVTLRPVAPGPHSITIGTIGTRPMPMPQSRPFNGGITVVHPQPMQSFHYAPQPAYHAGPSYQYTPAYHAPSYSAPAYRAPTPAYHYSAPSYHYSAPSYSAPSYHASAPAYHAPAPAPSTHYSAPAAPHYSAPAHMGGGFSGGGGGHHR